MSSISKAGIFVDVKQLMPFTQKMNKEMCVADRRDYGSKLIDYNLRMIECFTMAYHRRDEKIEFVAQSFIEGKRVYFGTFDTIDEAVNALIEKKIKRVRKSN